MGNNLKSMKVHAERRGGPLAGTVETECGTIGRTHVGNDEWRTGLGNPFRIGTSDQVTCRVCKQWVKHRKVAS